MRPLSVTALLVLAAFALGLMAGGQAPREAAAAGAPAPAPLEWKKEGKKLTFTNQETGAGYVVLGRMRAGAKAPAFPPPSASAASLTATDFDRFTVYRIQAVLACDSRECRKCQPGGPFACPAPPPIPIAPQEYQMNLAPKQIPR